MATKNSEKSVEQYKAHASAIEARADKAPVLLAEVLQQMGLSGPRVPAEHLKGQTITIYRAKPFQSSFNKDRNAWFCVFSYEPGGELFTTVLGGTAVVEILEAFAALGGDQPLTVTIDWVESGAFGGYYQLS